MKKIIITIALIFIIAGCNSSTSTQQTTNFDMMSKPSGTLFYEKTSLLTPEQYIGFINDRMGAVVVTTINADQSPNVAIVRPGVTEDGKYLIFGLAENRTQENIRERNELVFTNYQYDKTGGENGKSINTGFRMIGKYVGDEENKKLNEAAGTNPDESLYVEIVEVLPLG